MHIQKFLKQMFPKPVQKGLGINGFYLTYQLKQQPQYHCVTVSTEGAGQTSPFVSLYHHFPAKELCFIKEINHPYTV